MNQLKHAHPKRRQRIAAPINRIVIGCAALAGGLLACWVSGAQECRAGSIYFGGGGTITRTEFDGSNVTNLISASTYGIALDQTNGYLYWVEATGERIRRSDLDGTNAVTLVNTTRTSPYSNDFPTSIALDVANGHMYWTAQRPGDIRRANLDGSGVTNLVGVSWMESHLYGPDGISLDVAGGHMYWMDASRDSLRRAGLDGSSVTDLVTGLAISNWGSTALDLANSHIYWSTDAGAAIQRANLDGLEVTDIMTGVWATKMALDLENQHIYWTQDGSNSRIRRANLDGTGIIDIVSLSSYYNPHAIALDTVVPEPSSLVLFAGLFGIGLLWRRKWWKPLRAA